MAIGGDFLMATDRGRHVLLFVPRQRRQEGPTRTEVAAGRYRRQSSLPGWHIGLTALVAAPGDHGAVLLQAQAVHSACRYRRHTDQPGRHDCLWEYLVGGPAVVAQPTTVPSDFNARLCS